MTWLKEVFGKNKVVIGMVNHPPNPATPRYDEEGGKGLDFIYERIEYDLMALQEGGIDAVMFHNENDRPFVNDIGPEIVATMTSAITRVLPKVKVPFGVDVLANTRCALAIALATGASFVREDSGNWIHSAGELLRYRKQIGANHIKLIYSINTEVLAHRELEEVANMACSYYGASAVSVAYLGMPTKPAEVPEAKEMLPGGHVPHATTRPSDLARVKRVTPVPVFANLGVSADTVAEQLAAADGVIVGTNLKVDRITWNQVDAKRVKAFMKIVNSVKGR